MDKGIIKETKIYTVIPYKSNGISIIIDVVICRFLINN